MPLVEAIMGALGDRIDTPAAVLALDYARTIDAATALPASWDGPLRLLERAAADADNDAGGDTNLRAYHRLATALSGATLLSDLGPKLLAALDALQLTPKAQATLRGAVNNAGEPASPGDQLRQRREAKQRRHTG